MGCGVGWQTTCIAEAQVGTHTMCCVFQGTDGALDPDPESSPQAKEAHVAAAERDAQALLVEATGAEQRLGEARRGVRHATAELGGARAQGRALTAQIARLADQVCHPHSSARPAGLDI